MGENNKTTGTVWVNGRKFVGEGVTDLNSRDADDVVRDYVIENGRYIINKEGLFVYTIKCSKVKLLQVSGLWYWAIENCRNSKLVHLMKYGRNNRVKLKNFNRAMRSIIKHANFKEVEG